VLPAVKHTVHRYHIRPDLFDDFLTSMRMDLTITDYPDRAALDNYKRGSAEAIGLQLLPILGTVGPAESAAPGKAFPTDQLPARYRRKPMRWWHWRRLVATPTVFTGAVHDEPAGVIGPPRGGVALARAQAAIARRQVRTALAIFLRKIGCAPAWTGRLSKLVLVVALSAGIRRMAATKSMTARRSISWITGSTRTRR
jgi:Squalene/phytoene synthase